MSKVFPDKLTHDEMRDALLRSGYLIESRLESKLRKARRRFYVVANHGYPDPDTGKSRELDLYAMRGTSAGSSDHDYIYSILLIECVNNPQPLALITKESQFSLYPGSEIKLSGLPVKLMDKGSCFSLPNYLEFHKFHHYHRGRVATQFCSFRRKKDHQNSEWMALHEDAQFDCFRKLCAATDYFREEHFKMKSIYGLKSIDIQFYYPVLVVAGELLDVRPTKSSVLLAPKQHLRFSQSRFVRGEVEHFEMDVITESFFPKYLQLVEKELEEIAIRIRRSQKTVRTAINAIIRATKGLRSPEKISELLKF